MEKMKILDLFCGAGGAAMGYHQALEEAGIEHEITGIDIKPMPRYPFTFIQGDALEYAAEHGKEYDFIHASPPCQGYSRAKNIGNSNAPKLIRETRKLISGNNYVIENVVGAGKEMLSPTLLCGAMFGLGTYRHRYFETSFPLPLIMHPGHGAKVDRSSGTDREREMVQVWGKAQYKGYLERARIAMGIGWMNESEISEAIPPAYTRFIMQQFLGLKGK
jgi:DNA (cytosine-5)-methyltransferase 1